MRERPASTRESTGRTDRVTHFRETERNDLIPRSTVLLNLHPADTRVLGRPLRAQLRADIHLEHMLEKGYTSEKSWVADDTCANVFRVTNDFIPTAPYRLLPSMLPPSPLLRANSL